LLVLEYCSGGDLFDKLMLGGYMAPGEVLAYFQQLVVALQFSHRHGITHRDLKLENVLIDRQGRLRLADFGMASMMRPGSLLETACGSPNYCAPEVLSGELYDGARSDCWSLGVILYAMLTGGLPFDDDNFSRLVAKVRSGIFFIPDEVHPDAAAIVRALLVVNPYARMSLDDVSRTPWFNSQPFPAHLAPLRATVPRPLAATSASHDDPKGAGGGEGAGEDDNEEEDRDCSPIVEPVMPIVVHLTELGLGEIPTILRRLRSERRCVEKDFYKRIAAFVSQPGHSRSLEDELPLSPSTEGVGADSAQGDVLALLPGGVLPVSLADRPGTSADTGSLRSCADDAIRVR
jgi:serine/threonine protein kinase